VKHADLIVVKVENVESHYRHDSDDSRDLDQDYLLYCARNQRNLDDRNDRAKQSRYCDNVKRDIL